MSRIRIVKPRNGSEPQQVLQICQEWQVLKRANLLFTSPVIQHGHAPENPPKSRLSIRERRNFFLAQMDIFQ